MEEKMENEETKVGQEEELIGNEKEIAKLRKEITKLGSEKRDIAMMLTGAEMEASRLRGWITKVRDAISSYSILREQVQKKEREVAELNGRKKLLRQKLEEEREATKNLLRRIESLRISAEKFDKIKELFVGGALSKELLFQEIKKIVIPVEIPTDIGDKGEKK